MTKTKLDVVTRALQQIGVVGPNEAPAAEDYAHSADALDALFAEIKNTQEFTWTWGLDATPDEAFLPLAYLLASEVAPVYGKQGPNRAMALGRLRAYAFPDDRPLRADLDEDGTVTDYEAEASARAAFY